MTDTEALWIEQALKGDKDAFGLLVNAYQKPVFSLCYRMLGNSRDAEDAAQESFIRAYRKLKRYDQQRPFSTWLLSITAHYCIDQLRKRRLPSVSTEDLPPEVITDRNSPNPEHQFRKQEKENLVQNLVCELKPTDRAAVILRYWYDSSEVEIAESLNLSVSAVKSRLFRARRSLAELWIKAQQTEPVQKRSTHESPAF